MHHRALDGLGTDITPVDLDADLDVPTPFRADLAINGLGTLFVGVVTTIVIWSLAHDEEEAGPSTGWRWFGVWVVVGTPCCLAAGFSSLLTLLKMESLDPFAKVAPSLRCDSLAAIPAGEALETGTPLRDLKV